MPTTLGDFTLVLTRDSSRTSREVRFVQDRT
jgi:hypothetical protein